VIPASSRYPSTGAAGAVQVKNTELPLTVAVRLVGAAGAANAELELSSNARAQSETFFMGDFPA
jgi:hypothetical protein